MTAKTVDDYLRNAGDYLQSRLPGDDTHMAAMRAGMRDILNTLLPELGLPQLDPDKAPIDAIARLIAKGGTARQIHTAQSLRTVHRRQARRSAGVTRVIGAMRSGASLHCCYERGRKLWRLSDGRFVTEEVANVVIQNPNVIACGDTLFPGHPGQTWRYCND